MRFENARLRLRPLITTGLATFALAALSTACSEDVDSADVRTSGVHAEFTAVSEGSETVATGELRVGGDESNTYLLIEDDGPDALTLTVDEEEPLRLPRESSFIDEDHHIYSASVDKNEADTQFVFAFERGEDDTSAPDSSVTMPAPFDITAPASGEALSRGEEDLEIKWEPSGSDDRLIVTLSGDCITTYVHTVEGDPGTLTIPAGNLPTPDEDDEEEEVPDACDVEIEISKTRMGTLDPAYESGSVEAKQRRFGGFRSER